jgi:RsiW-degrading membrane proteinase PrsW (M82 family)
LSVILDTLLLKTKETTKSKHGEPKTSSILLISAAITMAIILLMYAGIYYTEGMMKQYSTCKDKIVGYEQDGMYPSPAEFSLALSFCDA